MSIDTPSNSFSYLSKTSLLKRSKCSGSSQECEKPSTFNATTVIVAVVVPVVVCLLFISFFVYRNWKKGKEEALEDNDPDFNGENTILPDIDMPYYRGGTEGNFAKSDGNPFEAGVLKYPNNVYSNQARVASYNQSTFFSQDNNSTSNTVTAGRYVDSFVLPYGEQTGSKKSLDQFARNLGSQYSAYAPADSSDHSRTSSLTRSVQHPFARSSENILSRTNLAQVISPEDDDTEATTKDSSDSAESKIEAAQSEKAERRSASTAEEEFEDSRSEIPAESSRPTSHPSVNTTHLLNNIDESQRQSYIGRDNRASYVSNGEELELEEIPAPVAALKDDDDDLDDPTLSADEREKLRRMKSIYNVYFDRENSIKHKRKDKNEEVVLPPLPALPTVMPSAGMADAQLQKDIPEQEEQPQNLTINTDFDRNYASSVYQENPLNDYEPYQRDLHAQQQAQQQAYNQQYYQQHQQYPQQYYPPPQGGRPQQPRSKPSLTKLNQLPTPRELNSRPFSSVNFYTDFEPKTSFKASSSPKVGSPQGFNPMEQWSTPEIGSQSPNQQHANVTPTAISRNSVTMTNPTIITKTKAYKPAGSLAAAANEYVRYSPQMVQSPIFGSHGGRSPMSPSSSQFATPTSEFGSVSGSKQGSRNQY